MSSWRNFETHRAETRAVKDALKGAGINAVVSHGRGTAWSWLEINVGNRHDNAGVLSGTQPDHWEFARRGDCPFCKTSQELCDRARRIAAEVTGRGGDHGGEILILTQSHWDPKQRKSVPILQPGEMLQPVLVKA